MEDFDQAYIEFCATLQHRYQLEWYTASWFPKSVAERQAARLAWFNNQVQVRSAA